MVLIGLVLPASAALAAASDSAGAPGGDLGASAAAALGLQGLSHAPLQSVHYVEPGMNVPGARDQGSAKLVDMFVLLTVGFSNQSRLGTLLSSLSEQGSPGYHQYLTAAEFDRQFSPSAATYQLLQGYLLSQGATGLTTYADRATLTFEGSSATIDAIFHTSIDTYQLSGWSYYAPATAPELPAPLAAAVIGIAGLSSFSVGHIASGSGAALHAASPVHPARAASAAGYLAPPTLNGVQLIYGPDLQVAYDEPSLLAQFGPATDQVIATILWGGVYGGGGPSFCSSLSAGEDVGAFVPSDVNDYFNETIPSGQAHAQVFGVPLNGAAAPGPLASCDSTGAQFENTLDLEMVGSTAPGASIYNVYGPTSSSADLDAAFTYILNPTGTPALAQVSVISNSWGGQDANDTGWFQDLEEAQARGITVLASSGDSGDNPASTRWYGSNAEFPASMAYNTFGTVAVGGTTLTLNAVTSSPSFLQIAYQVAWYISAQDTQDNGPAGSSGGVSAVFPEPSWQAGSYANDWIGGAGRGVPDLGAVANNTLITYSVNGSEYRATNASSSGEFFDAWGTSIACPVEAGIVAEIDHVLQASGEGTLGFLDPGLYYLADAEYSTPYSGGNIGYDQTGGYLSALPTLPLSDIVYGANYVYPAGIGYDLVTGWGSLDAYNYSMYFVSAPSSGLGGLLSGVEDTFSLSGLSVTSYFSNGTVNDAFNASIQQNFFVANSFGAPVYWIQNVIYIRGTPAGWAMNYTGWVIFPFYGQYPSDTIYTYNDPATGTVLTTPQTWDITTWLSGSSVSATMNFQVNGQTISLAAPGASFIIGSLSYSYSWQGVTYTNGPFPDNPVPGGLSPQFGLVGGPSSATGNFESPTAGNLTVQLEPYGSSSYVAASTEAFGSDIDQTGEGASNLAWTQSSTNSWTLGVSVGSATQGVLGYLASRTATYPVTFTESGLPAGTQWSVTLNGTTESSAATSIVFDEANGTYSYQVTPVSGYSASPSTGSVGVRGSALTQTIGFAPSGSSAVPYSTAANRATTAAATYEGGGWSVLTGIGVPVPQVDAAPSDTFYNATAPGCAPRWIAPPTSTFTFSPTSSTAGTSTAWLFELTQNVGGTILLVLLDGGNAVLEYTLDPGTCAEPASNQMIPAGIIDSPAAVTTANADGGSAFLQSHPDANGLWEVFSNTTLPGSGTYWAILYSTCQLSAGGGAGEEFAAEIDALSGSVAYSGTSSIDCGAGPTPHTVAFTESGLPSGTSWSVTFNGSLSSSTSTSIAFSAPNGTYDYTIGAVSGSTASPSGGTLAVVGSSVFEGITFTSSTPTTYSVEFTESGLPSGTSWSITLSRVLEQSSSGSIVFAEPNGTYTYTVGPVAGYTATPSSGSGQVAGAAQSLAIAFSPSGGGGGGGSSTGFLGLPGQVGYYLLVGIVVVVILGITGALISRSRRRGRGPPPNVPPSASPSLPPSGWPEAPPPPPPAPLPPPPPTPYATGSYTPSPYVPPPPDAPVSPPPGSAGAPGPLPPPSAPLPGGMGSTPAAFCSNCGKAYGPTSRFCSSCGHPR